MSSRIRRFCETEQPLRIGNCFASTLSKCCEGHTPRMRGTRIEALVFCTSWKVLRKSGTGAHGDPTLASTRRKHRCSCVAIGTSGHSHGGAAVKRILQPVAYTLAAIYLLADALFMGLAKPIADWVAGHIALKKLRAWIRSLPPYPSLALFSVPMVLLEPVKPVSAYLAATGQLLNATLVFISGELLKLVLLERLFSLTRTKLLKIPAFAWVYGHYKQAIAWLKASKAWKTMHSLRAAALDQIRNWRGETVRRLALAIHRR